MRYALLTLLAAVSSVALAQTRPQLTWQGDISGSAVLYIQEDRVDAQGRDTGSVDRPTIKMFQALPARRQTIEFGVRQGRGRVSVLEQPLPENEFTATVRIDPAGTGHETFVIDFFWNTATAGAESKAKPRPADRTGTSGRAEKRKAQQ